VLAASSSSEGFSVPVLVAAAGVAVLWWVVALVVIAMRRPPRIAPEEGAGLDLPAEPPAVAGVLAGDFEVVGETAPAVLLDLAARDFVALDEVQPGRTICRLRTGGDGPLTAYEGRVLAELRTKEVDGVVPADALTTGPEQQSKHWHRELAREVVADAQARHLTLPRWPARLVSALSIGLGVIVVLLVLSAVGGSREDDDTLVGAIAAAVAVGTAAIGAALTARLGLSLAQLPTATGHEAASRVVGLADLLRENDSLGELPPAGVHLWDRVFAYAAVFGAAPLAVSLLPMGAEDDHHAWSRVGGRWRRVRVRYPRGWPAGWGKHPLLASALGIFWAAVAAFVGYGLLELSSTDRPVEISPSDWDWVELGALVALVPVVLVLVWAGSVLARAVPDLWQTRTVNGDITRARRFRQWFSSGDDPDYWYYLAIDDGSGERIAAWRVSESIWRARSQGESIRAEVTPRLGYVRAVTPT